MYRLNASSNKIKYKKNLTFTIEIIYFNNNIYLYYFFLYIIRFFFNSIQKILKILLKNKNKIFKIFNLSCCIKIEINFFKTIF